MGSPEAEAENREGEQSLLQLFEDYVDIKEHVEHGRFIISGRKGSGKSAFAKYIEESSLEQDDLFPLLIRANELAWHKAVQNEKELAEEQFDLFFEWVILCGLVRMILSSNAYSEIAEGFSKLRRFYQKNAGIVDVDKMKEVEFLDETHKGVSINALRCKLFNTSIDKTCKKRQERASFQAFIPSLREIVAKLLSYQCVEGYDFVLMLDDLDVNFSLSEERDKRLLLSLIRVAKIYNTDYLKGGRAKVLLLVRDDICRQLDGIGSDKAKIFGSYEYKINWYDHDAARKDETKLLLRRFINKRIGAAFRSVGADYDEKDPWRSLVDNAPRSEYGNKSAFLFLLDFTFYRPRDLVNLFNKIEDRDYALPLKPESILSILKRFVEVNMQEIKDELTVCMSPKEIGCVVTLLGQIAKMGPIGYKELAGKMRACGLDVSIFEKMLEYDLIAQRDSKGHLYYRYREQICHCPPEECVYVLPKSILCHFDQSRIFSH